MHAEQVLTMSLIWVFIPGQYTCSLVCANNFPDALCGFFVALLRGVSWERQYVCRDLLTNINRSDYSHSLEKLHPGTVGNDDVFFDSDLPLQLRKGNKLHLTTFTERIYQK